MRWLIVSSRHDAAEGGIGAYVSHFVAAAADASWEVQLLTRPGPRVPSAAIVHEIETPDRRPDFESRIGRLREVDRIRPYRYGLWSLAVAEWLSVNRPDVDAVEFVDSGAEGFVSLTSRLVRRRWSGVPMLLSCRTPMWLVETESSFDSSRFGRSIYHAWERAAAVAADAVFAPSRALLDRMGAAGTVIPDFVGPAAAFGPVGPSGDEVIVLVGDLAPHKGVDTWARSLDRVLRDRPLASAMLIGADTPSGPNGTSMADHARSLVAPARRERFLVTGPLPHDAVLSWIRRASLVVVPSLFESFSTVAAEAVMRGTPVVVSEQVGLGEHVPSIRRVRVGDVEALAAAQVESLEDAARTRLRSDRCRDELTAVTRRDRLLAARRVLLESIETVGPVPDDAPDDGPDAIEIMRSALVDIERLERAGSAPVGVPA